MRFPLFGKRRSTTSKLVPTMLISVFFGLAAGAVGMLFANAFIEPAGSAYGSVFAVQSGHTTRAVDAIVRLPVSVETASRSAVVFTPSTSASVSLASRSVIAADVVAGGMVLTSDGWLISHANAFDGDPLAAVEDLDAVIGNRRYAIDEVRVDSFTGIVLMKVDGANLPVTVFDTEGSVLAGETGFSFDAAMGPRRVEIVSYDNFPPIDSAGLIRSSEHMQKVLRLSYPDADVLPGSMVVNGNGQVIGVYAGDAAIGAYAVPFAAFEAQIGVILREGRSIRPDLGVHYIDLSELVGVRETGERLRGALLVSDAFDERLAVIRRSPAEEGGLKEGDLILAVNGEELTANKALSDLIAEYQPGAVVTMSVRPSYTERMDGPDEIIALQVTLGAH